MRLDYITVFDKDVKSGQSNNGKGRIYIREAAFNTTEFAAQIFVEITDPLGDVIKAIDLGSPDMTFAGNPNEIQSWDGVDIPTAMNGQTLEGRYKVRIIERDISVNPSVDEESTYEYEFCSISSDGNGVVDIDYNADCINGILTVEDKSDYSQYTQTDYLFTLIPPTVPGVTIVGESTTSKKIEHKLGWQNVTYQATAESSITSSFVDDEMTFEYKEFVQGYRSMPIVCETDICKLQDCINEQLQQISNKAAAQNGFTSLTKADQDLYIEIQKELNLYHLFRACKDWDSLKTTVTNLKNILEEHCKCDDLKTTVAQPLRSIGGLEFQTQTTIQTDWTEIEEADLETDFDYPLSGATEKYPLRYRITATNHLEIEGLIRLNVAPIAIKTIVEDYFGGSAMPSYAPDDNTIQNPCTSDDGTPSCAVILQKNNGQNSWSLKLIRGSLAGSPNTIHVKAMFPLK